MVAFSRSVEPASLLHNRIAFDGQLFRPNPRPEQLGQRFHAPLLIGGKLAIRRHKEDTGATVQALADLDREAQSSLDSGGDLGDLILRRGRVEAKGYMGPSVGVDEIRVGRGLVVVGHDGD